MATIVAETGGKCGHFVKTVAPKVATLDPPLDISHQSQKLGMDSVAAQRFDEILRKPPNQFLKDNKCRLLQI